MLIGVTNEHGKLWRVGDDVYRVFHQLAVVERRLIIVLKTRTSDLENFPSLFTDSQVSFALLYWV